MLVGRRGCARGGGAVRYRAVSEDESESTASIAGSAADDDFVDDRLVYGDEEDGDGEDRVTGGDGGGGAGSYESFDACCRDLLLTSGPHAAPSSTHLRPSTGIEEAAAALGASGGESNKLGPPPAPVPAQGKRLSHVGRNSAFGPWRDAK